MEKRKRIKKNFLVVGIFLLMLSAIFVFVQGEDFSFYDVSVEDPNHIYDESGTSNCSNCYVQVIKTGPDGNIDPPLSNGDTRGDDYIFEGATSNLTGSPSIDDLGDGQFSATVSAQLTDKIYLRAWNAKNTSSASHYGNSETHFSNEENLSYNFGNFSTNQDKPEEDNTIPNLLIIKNKTNLKYQRDAINIQWNASDNFEIDESDFFVKFPSNQILYENYSHAIGEIDFFPEPIDLNETGRYVINFSANDSSGNFNSITDYFYVNDTEKPNKPVLNSPENNSNGVILMPRLNVSVSDTDTENLYVSFYNNSNQEAFSSECENITVKSGEWVKCKIGYLLKNTTYEWYANVTDGFTTVSSIIWNFTTLKGNSPPDYELNSPEHKETGVSRDPLLNVTIYDYEKNQTNITFYEKTMSGKEVINETVLSGTVLNGLKEGVYVTTYFPDGDTPLQLNSKHTWYIEVTDGENTTISDEWNFTVRSSNSAPGFNYFEPKDNSEKESLYTKLGANVYDPNGDDMNITFYNKSTDQPFSGCVDMDVCKNNKWVYCDLPDSLGSPLEKNTTYDWYVKVSDVAGLTTKSKDLNFTTLERNSPPEIELNYPEDGSDDISNSPVLNVTITDYEGNSTNVSFYFYNESLGEIQLIDEVSLSGNNLEFGRSATTTWHNLKEGRRYEWYVKADDGNESFSNSTNFYGKLWNFTVGNYNIPPEIELLFPIYSEKNLGISPYLNVSVKDETGDSLNVSFYNYSDNLYIGDIILNEGEAVNWSNVSKKWENLNVASYYEWYAVVDDGTNGRVYPENPAKGNFSTFGVNINEEPNNPSDGQKIITNYTTLNVTVSGPDDDLINVSFYNNTNDQVFEGCENIQVTEGYGYANCSLEDLPVNETYEWYVNVTDGHLESSSEVWNFTVINMSGLDLWTTINPPEGVFEPETGISLDYGTHKNTMSIGFENLTIDSQDTLRCNIKMSNKSIRVVEETGLTKYKENYSLNYTVQEQDSIEYDSKVGYLPWVLKNCSIIRNNNVLYSSNITDLADQNKTSEIYVHPKEYWDDSSVVSAGACIYNDNKYFNNTGRRCSPKDIQFARRMANGVPVDECYGSNLGACEEVCQTLPFQSCKPLDSEEAIEAAYSLDPNGIAYYDEYLNGSYKPEISYSRYVDSEGTFKLRLKQTNSELNNMGWSVTVVDLPNVSKTGTNIYGEHKANGYKSFSQNGESYNVFFGNNSQGGEYTGPLDFTFNISFNDNSMDIENHTFFVSIIFGTKLDNAESEKRVNVTFNPTEGYKNNDESEGNSSIYTTKDNGRCGDNANNDFQYIDGTWANSYDCYDPDCDGFLGPVQDNSGEGFLSGVSGLCNYQTETNCTDRYDNDFNDYTDCHDSDCFQNDPNCPSVETVCYDGENNDYDYTVGDTDDSSDEKIENNGSIYDQAGTEDLTDCEDIDCNGSIGNNAGGQICNWGHEQNCSDGFDNDALQLKDCELNTVSGPDSPITPADAEYDCSLDCRVNTGNTTETGNQCFNKKDDDWDALNITGYYSDLGNYFYNESGGIDCRWGGYFGYGENYNPDPDCDGEVSDEGNECQLERETNCTDEFDNDFDYYAQGSNPMPNPNWSANTTLYQKHYGQTYSKDADFDDYDCAEHPKVIQNEAKNASFCFDGIDNDLDAYYWNGSTYKSNDSTGIDCADPDCVGVEDPNSDNVCLAAEYNDASSYFDNLFWPGKYCADGQDNDQDDPDLNEIYDGDGGTDCEDSDCFQQFSFCSKGPCYDQENITWNSCADGQDQDYDASAESSYITGVGGVDCSDSDCYDNNMLGNTNGAVCQATETDCSDGFDNDDNGLVDCQDIDCNESVGEVIGGTNVYCNYNQETDCSDGFDNDGDGDIDYYDTDCDVYSGLSDVSGSNPKSLPQYEEGIVFDAGSNARVDYYTDELRKGENYEIRFIDEDSSESTLEWTLGTQADEFEKDSFGSAYLYGPDSDDFTLSSYGAGWTINTDQNHPGGYNFTFSVPTESVSIGSYKIDFGDGIYTGNNNFDYIIRENTAPVVGDLYVSPREFIGIKYGEKGQVRADISDSPDENYGICNFSIKDPNNNFEYSSSEKCKTNFNLSTEGFYNISVTPIDRYSNIGSVYSKRFLLNIIPTGKSIKTSGGSNGRFYNNSGGDALVINSSFNVPSTDNLQDCEVFAENETHKISLENFTAIGNICYKNNIDLSPLSNGLYTVYTEAYEDDDEDYIIGKSKAIFVCDNAEGEYCKFADFNSNDLPDSCPGNDNWLKPSLNSRSPYDGYSSSSTSVDLEVNVSDDSENLLNVTFYNSTGGVICEDQVYNNENSSCTWGSLEQGETYEWYVEIFDGEYTNITKKWKINIQSGENYPEIIEFDPFENEKGVKLYKKLRVRVKDSDASDNILNVTFYNHSNDLPFTNCIDVTAENNDWAECNLYESLGHSLEKNTTYKWYVNVSDKQGLVTESKHVNFTTLLGNSAPEILSLNSPENGKEDVSESVVLNVTITDYEGNSTNVTFYNSTGGLIGYEYIDNENDLKDGTYANITWSGLTNGRMYEWYVKANDSENYTISNQEDSFDKLWNFTVVRDNSPPNKPIYPSPADGDEKISLNPELEVIVSDPDAQDTQLDVSFYNNKTGEIFSGCEGVTSSDQGGNQKASCNIGTLENGTTYKWYANVTDGYAYNISDVWSFTTNYFPEAELNSPLIGESGLSKNVLLNITVSDEDEQDSELNVTFYNETGGVLCINDSVSDGSSVVCNWTGLVNGNEYSWYANVTDGMKEVSTKEKGWNFEIGTVNYSPNKPENPSPYVGKTGVRLDPMLSVKATDPDENDLMNLTFYNQTSGNAFSVNCTNVEVENDKREECDLYGAVGMLEKNTTYYWRVNVTDEVGLKNQSDVFNFTTTLENSPPIIRLINPENNTGAGSTYAMLNVSVEDPEENATNLTFYNETGGIIKEFNFTNTQMQNKQYASFNWTGLEKGKEYYWYVNATDGDKSVLTKDDRGMWKFNTLGLASWNNIIRPFGVYEPLCCGAESDPTSKTGQDCIDDGIYNATDFDAEKGQNGDVYCSDGKNVGSDVLHTMDIQFKNLTISENSVIGCYIETSRGNMTFLNKTMNNELNNEDFSLNYTLSPSDDVYKTTTGKHIPWYLHNCSVSSYGEIVKSQEINRRIYVHKSEKWSESDYTLVIGCEEGGYNLFMNNTAKCVKQGTATGTSYEADFVESRFDGSGVEARCYDGNTYGGETNKADGNDKYCKTWMDNYTNPDFSESPGYDLGTSHNEIYGSDYSISDYVFGLFSKEKEESISSKDITKDTESNLGVATLFKGDSSREINYTYPLNTDTSSGKFKVRVNSRDSRLTNQFNIVIQNLPQDKINSYNIIGKENGFPTEGNYEVSFNNGDFIVSCSGPDCSSADPIDIVMEFDFSSQYISTNDVLTFKFLWSNDQTGEAYSELNFTSDGLTNLDESQTNSGIGIDSCSDRENNDLDISSDYSIINNKNPFDQIGFSRDCADSDCSGETGPSIDGNSGDCEYKTETNCSDGYDNDFNDDYTQDLHWLEDGVAYADCHDVDCFQTGKGDCSATETNCADGINNDWDYTIGESDSPSDEKVNNSGTKYDHETYTAELTDCEDEDCDGEPGSGGTCEWGHEENCSDGFDNDDLQLKDCDVNSGGGFGDAEYDCSEYCRANQGNTETVCDDDIDNDWDLYYTTEGDFYSGTENTSDGAGIDCAWNGTDMNFNPDEDCDGVEVTFDGRTGDCELGTELTCDDGFDNDRDNDASDSDTRGAGWSKEFYENEFGEGNYSKNADCDDYDCNNTGNCPTDEGNNSAWCFDGADNDLDGLVDCEDPDCIGAENPNPGSSPLNNKLRCAGYELNATLLLDDDNETSSPNYCGNLVDDEGNPSEDNQASSIFGFNSIGQDIGNYADCNDADCRGQFGRCAPCSSNEYVEWDSCFDGIDNDHDGIKDQNDPNCSKAIVNDRGYNSSNNPTSETDCMDGFDNDGDGDIDENDADCDNEQFSPDGRVLNYESPETTCDDGIDNDGNGNVDCFDINCYTDCGITKVSGISSVYNPKNETQKGMTKGEVDLTYPQIIRKGNDYIVKVEYTIGQSPGESSTVTLGSINNPIPKSAFDLSDVQCSGCSENGINFITNQAESDGLLKLEREGGLDSGTTVYVIVSSKNKVLNPQRVKYSVSGFGGNAESILGSSTDVEVLNNQEPSLDVLKVEPEKQDSGEGNITVGDNLQIIGGNLTGYSGGQVNSGKQGKCKIKIKGPLYGTSVETKTVTTTDCQYEFPITTTGSYDITVTPYDNTGLKGPSKSKNLILYVAPKITSSLTRIGERVHFNDTINEFTLDYADSTGEMIADFKTGKEANYGSGSCGAIIYNQTGDIVKTSVIRKENLGNKEIKCTLDSSLSGLGLDDGMYYVKINATDSNGYELTTQRKVFYMCNNLTSEGTNWECSLADFDADGYTDGIKQPFNYSNGTHMYEMACDSCPGQKNLNVDVDGDGIDAVCDPDNPNVTVGAPENFTAYLADNDEDVTLNWSVVPEAQGYIIWHGENVSNILNINDENTNIENANITIGDTNQVSWTDTNASKYKERYYRIAAYRSDDSAFNEDSNGKYDILVRESDGSASEEGNLISLPLIPLNNSLDNLIRHASGNDIPPKDGGWQDRITTYNLTEDSWLTANYYGPSYDWWGSDFDRLEIGKGYFFKKVNDSYNLTIVGKVPTSELGISVKEADGSASSEGNLLGWNSPVEKCNLSELLPDASGNDIPPKDGGWQDRITTYNLTEDSWLTANYYGSTWGWFGADFDCFEPGRAYFFKKVNSSYTWIQERDPRQ